MNEMNEINEINEIKKDFKAEKIIIEEVNETKFLDLDVFWYVALPFFHSPSRDKNEFKGSITNLPEILKWN